MGQHRLNNQTIPFFTSSKLISLSLKFIFFKIHFFNLYGNTAGTPSASYPENIDDLNIIDKRGEREVIELLDILENIDDDLDRLGISMVKV